MSDELRPCPACGSGEEYTEIDFWLVANGEERGRRACRCGAASPWSVANGKEDRGRAEIDAAWDSLPRREDAQELVEALREIKDEIEDCDECRCGEVLEIARAALAKWGK